MSVTTVLFTLASLLVLGLATYLARLLITLKRQRDSADAATRELERSNQARHDERIRSIELLTLAALAGDLDLSEACIRVHHLLRDYPGLAEDERLRTIAEMFAEIDGFATHERRMALSPRERRDQDRARLAIEQRYRRDLLASFKLLRERMQSLHGSRFDIELATGTPAVSRPRIAGTPEAR